ncbi:DUF417 family protein [Thalassotalea fusca]
MTLFHRTNAVLCARVLVGIFLLTTAMNRFNNEDVAYFNKQLSVLGLPELVGLSFMIGLIQIMVVIALLKPRSLWSRRLFYTYAVLALIPMVMLFTHPVWIDSLGGFPAIGAGQGLIKYLGISGVILYIASYFQQNDSYQKVAKYMMLLGVLLVMTWIGGMKFTQIEADGIYGLMSTSPFFSWIYTLFSSLHGSYFIGVVELIAVLAICCYQWNRSFYAVGLAMCALTFIATQTFIITLPAFSLDSGIPLLTGSGQFIVKDLGLLAGCMLLFSHYFYPREQI